jgi:hypothetical protein
MNALERSLEFIHGMIMDNETNPALDQDLTRVHKILTWVQANEPVIKAVAGIFNSFPGAVVVSGMREDESETREANND